MANTSLVQLIKRAAMEAFAASRPCDAIVGTVVNTGPLEIKISQNLTIDNEFLVLTRNVTDYVAAMEADNMEKRNFKVFNGLKKDEKVLLIRKPGGQRYIVTDRVVGG